MADMNKIWLIINMVMAILLAVSSIFAFTRKTASAVFQSLFFLTLEIIICIIPFVAPLNPYFQFLTSGVGAPIMLLIIACFYFGSLQNFCQWGGWSGCYGSVVGVLVFIVCIVELVFKKDELKQVGQQAANAGKSAAQEGKQKFSEIKMNQNNAQNQNSNVEIGQNNGSDLDVSSPTEQVKELE